MNLKTLKEKLEELEEDNMDLVKLRIVGGIIDNGNIFPAFLHFDGLSHAGAYKDYESIDEASLL